ncbi:MAG: biopolymer transporter ExbD [Planctomycetota bacterium]|nr:biopolymer transporter ExbD [Planctomycetota bacterium]
MAMSGVHKPGPAEMTVNMTPMIDCIFQLLIFFMLTTQMASADFVNMKVPKPDFSQAKKPQEGNKAVVNVEPFTKEEISENIARKGMTKQYSLAGLKIERGNTEKLIRELDKARRTSEKPKEFVVELRADKSIRYDQIEPVLRAMQRAELGKMFITAMREQQG